jgi:hypothetical protein
MKASRSPFTSTVFALLPVTQFFCVSEPLGTICNIPQQAPAATQEAALAACTSLTFEGYCGERQNQEYDILFVLDNSPSMTQVQQAVAQAIPELIALIDGFPNTDYHIGVVSSDVGATTAPGMIFSDPMGVLGACNTYSGDDGNLQMTPCTQRINGSPEAKSACAAVCTNPDFAGPNLMTTDGSHFIKRTMGKTNLPPDVQGGMDISAIDAFKCIGLLGDGGCAMASPLEAAKRALDGHLPGNANFLTPGAYLLLIFITNQDDCSVQLSRRAENDPATMDCPTPAENASYSCYNFDYRCLASSIQCSQPMNQQGSKTNCQERPGNYLNPVQMYHDTFRSYVPDSAHLMVIGLWTLPSLEQGAPLNIAYFGGGTSSADLNRGTGSLAACTYTGTSPQFSGIFGQAQSRLSEFADTFGYTVDPFNPQNKIPITPEYTICDPDHYTDTIKNIPSTAPWEGPVCLPGIPQVQNGQPLCLVGEVDANQPNGLPDLYFPVCSSTCCQAWANSINPTPFDPNIQTACAAESQDCFCAVQSTVNSCPPGNEIMGVWRTSTSPQPTGKVINFRCAGSQ